MDSFESDAGAAKTRDHCLCIEPVRPHASTYRGQARMVEGLDRNSSTGTHQWPVTDQSDLLRYKMIVFVRVLGAFHCLFEPQFRLNIELVETFYYDERTFARDVLYRQVFYDLHRRGSRRAIPTATTINAQDQLMLLISRFCFQNPI